MFLRRLFLSCTLLSVGLLGSLMAGPEALGQMPAEPGSAPAAGEASLVEAPASETVLPRLEIEDRFEAIANETLFDYKFSGRENEMVVIYVAINGDYRPAEADLLLSSNGELALVQRHAYYPPSIDLNESAGSHIAYRLPETGEYTLRLGGDLTGDVESLVRIRSASYYERLMMAADEKQSMGLYDDASRLFGLAIAQRPEQPTPYSSRIELYIGKVIENSSVQEDLLAVEEPSEIIEIIHTAFLTLEEREQNLMIDDFVQVARAYEIAIANGSVNADDFNPVDLAGISEFLQTGISNGAVERVLFGADR